MGTIKTKKRWALTHARPFFLRAIEQNRLLSLCALGAATIVISLAAHSQEQPGKFFDNSPTPSFTADQAKRGATAYTTSCTMCHGENLDDGEFGPPLKGASFKKDFGSQSAEALLTYMISKMPTSAPGSLDRRTYADLEAFILQSNGVAPGTTELAPANVSAASAPQSQAAPPQENRGAPTGFPQRQVNRDAIYQAAMAHRTAALDHLAPVTDEMLQHPSDGDWLMWRRTYSSLGHSPLRQINASNVNNLRVAWSRALAVGSDEITPLVHDGVIFIESADTIQAIDGATGDLLWQYLRPLPDVLFKGRNSVLRGIAIYQDMLFAPTADGHVVALDVKTGKVVWDHQVIYPASGGPYDRSNHDFRVDGAPIVVKDKVIIGVSLGITSKEGGCFIVGLDSHTGDELWRFHTIPRPGEPGGDSWNGAPVDQRFGASVWTAGSYDPDLNLVYFGTGNTYDTATLLEPQAEKGKSNDGLYTDSTVALNPDTGKLAWYYQHMNRDVWDLDWSFEQSLITLPIDGKPTNLLVTGGKIAIFDALDRSNGHYEFSKDVGLQNIVASIDPETGKKIINPELEPKVGKTALLCPSPNGARSWPATSYDPDTKILYIPMNESCTDYSYAPRDAAATEGGGEDMRFGFRLRPDTDGKFGRIEAINLQTKEAVWTDRQRAPIESSMLSTAGGIVFNGARDREFTAYDAATGKLLWQTGLNAAPSSSPVTYTAGGKQYIAVVAGGGGPLDASGGALAPELENPAGGTTLWIFDLPDKNQTAQQ